MRSAPVIVFLSTGRCGTQWLTENLRDLYPGIGVQHEPVGALYSPRRYFRHWTTPEAVLEVPEVARHLGEIESHDHLYVETGWPVLGALPLMVRRLPSRLRVVHLTRHPVPTALSHAVHNSYADSARDDPYTRLATLGPTDPHVFQPHYAQRWDELTGYEKCLFWWTEVSLFGLELERLHPEVPFLRIRSEELLTEHSGTITRLLRFMELPWDERWTERTARIVDRWHHHTDQTLDPRLIYRHPLTCRVAEQLGYDVGELDLSALRTRYVGRPDLGLDRAD